ncbi:hypothetical protein E8P82_13990 [Arthrobacter echini]|uniref:Uncharacterized protein n=2 Tax=Arthrobacter echini TaxID=1529066 RepID=A0A4S5E0H6_9MICC|nr:hypothetical protein [Arthrobacter echini]THJ64801.1 hypothetical protein E8P82_13990 [Arthrobacter echini]TYC97140.1 hypothetical protein FQ377_13285 [Arthrobacter echini]
MSPNSASDSTPDDPGARYRRLHRQLRFGQILMILGALLALIHMIAHLAPPEQQPGLALDIAVGYPAAALIFVIGATLAGQKKNP